MSQVVSVLRCLQSCSQASLQRETHYWLTYICVLLTYSISRRLLETGHSSAAVEPLLWAAICMESSVPLVTLKFLQLRVDIYVAVCQCYFQVKEPRQAEVFARRGLEKVHELALLEHQSSSASTQASERVFHEATLKLGVVIFRRSVLESRLTRKTVFRPKKRPTIRELLQQLFPRSPTEKLLVELFPGEAARFLAILEALTEPGRDPLAKGLPQPITNLDADTTADVMQVSSYQLAQSPPPKEKTLLMSLSLSNRSCCVLEQIWLCDHCSTGRTTENRMNQRLSLYWNQPLTVCSSSIQ